MAKKPTRKPAQKPAQKPVVILPWVLLTRWWAPPKAFGLALATQAMSYRRRYDNGERVYVLHALDACLNNGYLPEPWMLKGLWDAVTALDDGADPNEAFAFALSEGKHVGSNRKKRRDTFPILFRIYDLHCNKGLALDESEGGAFRTVAKEFPYGTRTIRRILWLWLRLSRRQRVQVAISGGFHVALDVAPRGVVTQTASTHATQRKKK